jgi:hypothetical protein
MIIIALFIIILSEVNKKSVLACNTLAPIDTFQNTQSTIFESTEWIIGGEISEVETDGSYAYIVAGQHFLVLDVHDPKKPAQIAFVNLNNYIFSLAIGKNYAFVGTPAGLYVIDITSPATPVIAGCATDVPAGKTISSNEYIYSIYPINGLDILEISESGNLTELSAYQPPQPAPIIRLLPKPVWIRRPGIAIADIAVSDQYIYVLEGSTDDTMTWGTYLRVLDISNPRRPSSTSVYKNLFGYSTNATRLFTYNNNLFLTGNSLSSGSIQRSQTIVMDLSNPADPVSTGVVLPDNLLGFSDDYAYFAPNPLELEIWLLPDLYSPARVSVINFLENPSDVAFSENNLFVVTPGEGLQIFDTTNKSRPEKISSFITVYSRYSPDVSDDKAFTHSGRTLQIVDLTDLNKPKLIESLLLSTIRIEDIAVQGSNVYAAIGSVGLWKINILDPTNPVIEDIYKSGSFTTQVAANESYVYIVIDNKNLEIIATESLERISSYPIATSYVQDMVATADYLYISTTEGRLLIFDISNPTNVVQVGYSDGSEFSSDFAINDRYLFVNSRNSINIFDISQPDNPSLIETYQFPVPVSYITLDKNKLYAFSMYGLMILTIKS